MDGIQSPQAWSDEESKCNNYYQSKRAPQPRIVVPVSAFEFDCLRQQAGYIPVVLINDQNLPEQLAGADIVPAFERLLRFTIDGFKFWFVSHFYSYVIASVFCEAISALQKGTASCLAVTLFTFQLENSIRCGGVDITLLVHGN